MLQQMLAMNAMKENPHVGRPVYTPGLTVHFRVAGEVLGMEARVRWGAYKRRIATNPGCISIRSARSVDP
eukprot:COSAG02_NODE_53764_length_299_cov_13.515000_1_plen_69_part_01